MDWNACLKEAWPTLGWMECHPGFAGYLQAAGSVAAIAAGAIMIVWQQSKVRALAQGSSNNLALEKRAKQIALAYRLDLLVDDIIEHYALVISSHSIFNGGLFLIGQGPSRLDDAIKVMTINVQWDDGIFNDMSVMPQPIQESVTTLLYMVSNYNRETEAVLRHGCKHGVHTVEDVPEQELAMLKQIDFRMNEANKLLEALLPPPIR